MKITPTLPFVALFTASIFALPPQLQIHPNIQPIWCVADGSGGQYVYPVDFNTGVKDWQHGHKITFQGSPINGSVFGLARKPNQSTNGTAGIITVIENGSANPCGGGTAFYNVDLNYGSAAKLGTAVNYTYIKDIEYNPVDGKLYGIWNDILVWVSDTGTPCSTSGNGIQATIYKMGRLSGVGVGPYGIAFDYAGGCHIVSGKDHKMAVVTIPLTPPLQGGTILPLPTLPTTPYHAPVPDLGTSVEVAACISGETLIVATSHFPQGSTYLAEAFYHWGTPNWTLGGANSAKDYTSIPADDRIQPLPHRPNPAIVP